MSGLEGAACAGEDPALFESLHPIDHEMAAEICARCPARAACTEVAESMNKLASDHHPVGTWGGKLYGASTGPGRGRRNPREHGTQRGYDQHRYLGEYPCGLCVAAHYVVLDETFGVLG